MNKKVLIIGYGTVGRNIANELQDLHPDIVDKNKKNINTIKNIHYDLGIICVNTSLNENSSIDIDEVINSINDYNCEIFCIKSTCPVGTVEYLSKQTGKRIVFSPEYYGNTKHCNNYCFDFTILGGNKEDYKDEY